MAHIKTAIIRPCAKSDIDPDRPISEQKICLYSKSTGKLLGRHPSEESAKKQEVAIQISKHGYTEKEAIALELFLLSQLSKYTTDYVKSKMLRKPAEKIWKDIFENKRYKLDTIIPIVHGMKDGRYQIEATNVSFHRGNAGSRYNIKLIAAFWRMKKQYLLVISRRSKELFSKLDPNPDKLVLEASKFIDENLVYPEINRGDVVSFRTNGILQYGEALDSWDYGTRIRVQLLKQDEFGKLNPIDTDNSTNSIWINIEQVEEKMRQKDRISKTLERIASTLDDDYPDLAQKVREEILSKYEAQTDLEKMIGEMYHGQSGKWLTKNQMQKVVSDLKKQGITKPAKGKYDEIAQAVGKALDKVIPG